MGLSDLVEIHRDLRRAGCLTEMKSSESFEKLFLITWTCDVVLDSIW
jgi:hypothetical protein